MHFFTDLDSEFASPTKERPYRVIDLGRELSIPFVSLRRFQTRAVVFATQSLSLFALAYN
jgi:hypothetical protein